MNTFLVLILLFPLLGGIFNALSGLRIRRRLGQGVACAAVWASFISSVAAFALLQTPFRTDLFRWISAFDFNAPFSLYFDNLAAVMCVMVTFVWG